MTVSSSAGAPVTATSAHGVGTGGANPARPLLFHTAELLEYSFGEDHPMGPDRVRLAMELSDHFGVLDAFDIVEPPPSDMDLIRRVHGDSYIEALTRNEPDLDFGIGDNDHPLAPSAAKVAARIATTTTAAVQAVWTGQANRALNLAGGLHHALSHRQSGFCTFNDAAIAIDWLLEQGASRVVYLDLDAHHGDGVEAQFWDDPRVLTISIHESGLYLFPYTGFAKDIGGPNALGTAVNIAVDRYCEDGAWLQALHAIVAPLLRKFKPEIIVSQHGADPHRGDPLADLNLSIEAMTEAYRTVGSWADKYANGKWVAIGGGGYNRDSVARAWTQLAATVADVTLDHHLPMPDRWDERVRMAGARTLGDGVGELDFHPERLVEVRACAPMIATSRAIFPYWGLRPFS